MEPGAAMKFFTMGNRWQRLGCKKYLKVSFYFNMKPRLSLCRKFVKFIDVRFLRISLCERRVPQT